MKIINQTIVSFVKLLPKSIVHIFGKKYVAGETLNDALRVVKELNSKGILATIDVLGEAITNLEEASQTQRECLQVLDLIQTENLNANISIKPTSLGLGINPDICYNLVEGLVKKAASFNNFVRIDMENSPFTDLTINLFKKLKKDYPENVGIVVQAYLKRTYEDVVNLNPIGTNYRLCKGIYVESPEIAIKNQDEINKNYLMILNKMLDDKNFVGIATHNEFLINKSYGLLREKHVEKSNYEFQMLYGVREDLRDRINNDGHKIRVYVPFGVKWYEYSIRRLQENPQLAWYITKSLFSFK